MTTKVKAFNLCLRFFAALATLALGVSGSILLIISVYRVNNLPASKLCEAEGYPGTNCSSTGQDIFQYRPTPICLLKPQEEECPLAPPPCCVGRRNLSSSFNIPPGNSFLLPLNQISCHDLAESMRSGLIKCGTRPPCNVSRGINLGENISSADLDDYKEAAFKACSNDRLDYGYLFLFLTGPVVMLPAIILAIAHFKESKALATYAIFLGTLGVAVVAQGASSMLDLKSGLGWEVGINCNEKSSAYVSGGKYLDTYYCIDQTIGGSPAMNPAYDWLESSMTMYFTGAALSVSSLCIYVTLLVTACARIQPDKENYL